MVSSNFTATDGRVFFFFFSSRRRHTRCLSDWSSDVCSSDLTYLSSVPSARMRVGDFSEINRVIYDPITHLPFPGNVMPADRINPVARAMLAQKIGRASCRERGVELGGRSGQTTRKARDIRTR